MKDGMAGKRQSKKPTWMEEVEDPDALLSHGSKDVKRVFRLLRKSDVSKELVGREVFTLWPDNGMWYKGKVRKCNPADMSAMLYYQDTNEKEEADLEELVNEKQIAFSEERPANYVCKDDEIEQGQHNLPEPGAIDHDDSEYDEEESSRLSEQQSDEADDEDDETLLSRSGRKRRIKKHDDFIDDEELGDELPLSMRVKEAKIPRHEKRNVHEDEDAVANKLLASAIGKSKGNINTARRMVNHDNDPQVREKVRSALQQGLDMAFKEAAEQEGSGGAAKVPDPAKVAAAVEDALFVLYSGTTKDYKAKMRSLHFNLKDPHNAELRAHVLRGHISPDNFVQMTATELASKELTEYRKRKEEEALKMSVLDAEAASMFSTAAALEARGKFVKGSSPPLELDSKNHSIRENKGNIGGPQGVLPVSSALTSENAPAPQHGQGEKHDRSPVQDPMAGIAEDTLPSRDSKTTIDWASVKSASVQASKEQFKFIPEVEQDLMRETMQQDATVVDRSEAEPQVTAPSFDEKLKKIFLPCPEPLALGADVWQGSVSVPGVGTSTVSADALAGCGDMQVFLTKSLNCRGRLSLDKLDAFLSELHLSKHRTASVAILKPSSAVKPASTDVVDFSTIVANYTSKERAGVAESLKGAEIYLVPPGALAQKILNTVFHLEPDVVQSVLTISSANMPEMSNDMLLAVAVHKKEMVAKKKEKAVASNPPPAEVSLPEGLDFGAIAALVSAVGANAQPAPPMNSSVVPPPAPPPRPMQTTTPGPSLPENLDLSAISALASALGVPTEPTTVPMAPAAPKYPPMAPYPPAAMRPMNESRRSQYVPMQSAQRVMTSDPRKKRMRGRGRGRN